MLFLFLSARAAHWVAVGIVVDYAIVIAENAARRMFSPVFSATLTKISAFFALVVIGGRFGSLMADIPFTVIVVLAASLVECFLSHGALQKTIGTMR